MIAGLVQLKRRQYQRTHMPDALAAERHVRLLAAMNEAPAPDCHLVMNRLEAGDRVLAQHLGPQHHEVLSYWFPVYDPEASNVSPGRLLLWLTIQRAEEYGIALIDRGEGDMPHKRELARGRGGAPAGHLVRSRGAVAPCARLAIAGVALADMAPQSAAAPRLVQTSCDKHGHSDRFSRHSGVQRRGHDPAGGGFRARPDLSDYEILLSTTAAVMPPPKLSRPMTFPAIRLLRLARNHGEGGVLNEGIAVAKGDLIAFLDADDEWLPTKLAKQVKMPAGELQRCHGHLRLPVLRRAGQHASGMGHAAARAAKDRSLAADAGGDFHCQALCGRAQGGTARGWAIRHQTCDCG